MSDRSHDDDAEHLIANATFLRRLARSLIDDEHGADDAAQEAWLAALRSPPRARFDLRAWLAGVVRHLAAQARRRERRLLHREAAAAVSEKLPAADTIVARVEILERVVAAVKALDEPYRTTVLMRFFEDLSSAEIARRSGVPEATVRTRLRRALAELRTRLDRDRDGDRRAWCDVLLPFAMDRPMPTVVESLASFMKGVLTVNPIIHLALITVLATAGLFLWQSTRDPEANDALVAAAIPAAPEPVVPEPAAAPARTPARAVMPFAPDRDLDLFGRVTDRSGAAIEGALIETILYPWWRVYAYGALAAQTRSGPQASSAPDGTFAIRLERGQFVNVRVSAAGFAATELEGRYAGEQVAVILLAPVSVRITVHDEQAKPVAGASVKFGRAVWRSRSECDTRDGVTDSDGVCVLSELSPGPAWVSVDRAFVEPGRREIVLAESGTTTVAITLPVASEVSGRVTDAITGQPIVGALVDRELAMRQPVVTDASGAYTCRVRGISSDAKLHVAADGYAGAAVSVPNAGTLDFALVPGDSVRGRLLRADGTAVADALVAAMAEQLHDADRVIDARASRSLADGTFTIGGLRRDLPHTLLIVAPGDVRLLLDFDPRADRAGEIDLGDLTLPAGRSIEGRVLTIDEQPYLEGRVILSGHNDDRGRLRPHGDAYACSFTDREARGVDDLGRFRFPDLPPGSYTLTLESKDGHGAGVRVELGPDADVLDAVLQLHDTGSLSVLVTDPSGVPLGGAEVIAFGNYKTARVTTDLAGHAMLSSAPGNELSLQATLRGYVSSSFVKAVPEGQEVRLVLAKGSLVDGVVLAPDGTALDNMQVQIVGRGSPFAWTDAQGRFAMLVPEGEPVSLEVSYERKVTAGGTRVLGQPSRYRGKLDGVAGPASNLVIQTTALAANGTLRVLVLDPDGDPAPAVHVIARGTGVSKEGDTGSDGLVTLDGLTDEVTLRSVLLAGSGLPETMIEALRTQVTVHGQQVTLSLREGVIVTGVVLDPEGHAVADATVNIHKNPPPETGGAVAYGPDFEIFQGTTDASGRFRIAIAIPDRFRVAVQHTLQGGRKLYGVLNDRTDPAAEMTLQLKWE